MDKYVILVSTGSYSKILRINGLNNTKIFLTILEAEKYNVKSPTNFFLPKYYFRDVKSQLLAPYSHMEGKDRKRREGESFGLFLFLILGP